MFNLADLCETRMHAWDIFHVVCMHDALTGNPSDDENLIPQRAKGRQPTVEGGNSTEKLHIQYGWACIHQLAIDK